MSRSQVAEPFAAPSMYPVDGLRPGGDDLYAAVAERVGRVGPRVPSSPMRWDLDQHATWLDPAMVAGMACGWPLITALRDQVRVVGTFAYALDDVVSHLYRSRIIARADAGLSSIDAVDPSTVTAALNSSDSLSGCISLLASVGRGHRQWPGQVEWTGAHVLSIDAVRSGRADIASIDGLTWAFLARDEPHALDGLITIGRGPLVPCLPIIVNRTTTDDELATWRDALVETVRDPAMVLVRETLMIRDFVPLEYSGYVDALRDLQVLAQS